MDSFNAAFDALLSEAFLLGRRTGLASYEVGSNPYPPATLEAEQWQQGVASAIESVNDAANAGIRADQLSHYHGRADLDRDLVGRPLRVGR